MKAVEEPLLFKSPTGLLTNVLLVPNYGTTPGCCDYPNGLFIGAEEPKLPAEAFNYYGAPVLKENGDDPFGCVTLARG